MTLDEPIAARGFQYKHGDKPLEGFTIQRAAGRGGFGEVYYAVSDSGREVALKLVHTYEQIELRGISQCMNLKSPHLVTIFDVKYGDDGRPWVIMEFVNGPSLRELLDAAPSGLGPAKAAFFLREIGKGLTYLHDCGIVHRDLKPGNIFYENSYVKIGDYGLSKTMSVTRHSGQTVAVGTLHYMAPEIGEGCYDRSIDIYALGALLFEMLTGQVPFLGSSPAEVLMKHLTSDVNLDAVEEPFRSTIRKAMAKNPADRFQSVQEMVDSVFGFEQIQSSVSQVSPESLTMVAGRVAQKIGSSGQAGNRKASPDPAPRPSVDWFERGAEQLHKAAEQIRQAGKGAAYQRTANRMNRAAERVRRAGDRVAARTGIKWKWNDVNLKWQYPSSSSSNPDWPAGADPITGPVRLLLAFMVIFLASFIAMSNVGSSHRGDVLAMVFMGIIGAMIGSRVAWGMVMPGIAEESTWMKRLALGAPAALGAALLSFPFWIANQAHTFDTIEASFIGLLLLHWDERLAPQREERFSVGHLITSAILGMVLAGFFNAEGWTVIGIVTGASLAASLCAPWNRGSRGPSGVPGAPRPAPIDAAPNAPEAPPASSAPSGPPPIPPAQPSPAAVNPPKLRKQGIEFRIAGAIAVFALLCFVLPQHTSGGFPVIPFMIAAIVPGMVIWIIRGGSMSSRHATSIGQYSPESVVTLTGVASGLARFVFSFLGGLMLLVSLVLAIAVRGNLVGLITSGAVNPEPQMRLAEQFGDNWPEYFNEFGATASFLAGAAAIVFLSLARRSRGGLHMVRGIIGVLWLFVAAGALGSALPIWAGFVPSYVSGANVDWIFRHIDRGHLMGAALIAAVGYTILLWPPRRHTLQAATANQGAGQ